MKTSKVLEDLRAKKLGSKFDSKAEGKIADFCKANHLAISGDEGQKRGILYCMYVLATSKPEDLTGLDYSRVDKGKPADMVLGSHTVGKNAGNPRGIGIAMLTTAKVLLGITKPRENPFVALIQTHKDELEENAP